ncbi:MAG: MATE family efflux transporter [Prevotella sp.]
MFNRGKNDALLASVREGKILSQTDKINLVVSLSVPSILAQITNVLMFYIDTAMVGALGAKASAAVGLMQAPSWLYSGITTAAALGFSVQVAHFVGSSDFEKARQVARHGIVVTFLLSIVVTLIGVGISSHLPFWLGGGSDISSDASKYFMIYTLALPFLQLGVLSTNLLKSTGNMVVPSVISVMMCVCDVIFNYIFIFIFKMGVAGAALGTLLSIVIAASSETWFTFFRSSILAVKKRKERFVWRRLYIKQALKISTPVAAQYILMTSAQIVSTMIVAPLGNFAIAAHTFAIAAESLCYMPGLGIGEAATTLVGQSYGAGQYQLCRSFARITVTLGMIVMAFMGFIMFMFAPEMIGFMSPVPEIRELGIQSLRIASVAEIMFAASIVGNSVCVGVGDTLKPAIMNLFSMWGVRLTLAACLAPIYGLKGVWIAMSIELTFRGLMFLLRLSKGRWMKLAPKGI